MALYDNEENAVVNTQPETSETPSNLVNDNLEPVTSQEELDKKLQYKKDGNVNESKLSPNPAGFGFTKQYIVDELPENGEPNTLYLVQVKNDGVVVGYRKYKWTPSDGYCFVGVTPDQKLVDGPRETPIQENNLPKIAPEKVFNGKVVFNQEPDVEGKPLHEWIDREGGVTEEELHDYVKANPTLAGTESELSGIEIGGVKYKAKEGTIVTPNPSLVGTEAQLESLQVGSTKYKVLTSKAQGDLSLVEGLFPDFSTSATYEVGNVVRYNNALYQCKTRIATAGAWDSTKWVEFKLKQTPSNFYEVSNMQNIPPEICEQLKNGDVISCEGAAYTITFAEENESFYAMCFHYDEAPFDAEEVYYLKSGGTWAYQTTNHYELGGGTKLYKHEIYIDDSNGEDALDRTIWVISASPTVVINENAAYRVLWLATSPMFLLDGVASEYAFFDAENSVVSLVNVGGHVSGNLDLTSALFSDTVTEI